ncbi:hypothetical protein XENORESO_015152 [Xenotaenia resolanae]|uniref:F-BAR domain-containing protein n=1 Tax=Xenotaenia resolanae TaxID=208358 RepID=A0ABV0WXE4_9TELE
MLTPLFLLISEGSENAEYKLRVVKCKLCSGSHVSNWCELFLEKQYKSNIEQLDQIRQEWESTHIETCEMFQQQEEDRISVTRNALWVHCNQLSMQCVKDDECCENVRKSLENCDINTDNNNFVEMKKCNPTPPAPIEYQNYYANNASVQRNGSAGFVEGVKKRFSNLLPGSCTFGSKLNINEGVSEQPGMVPKLFN